MVIAAASSAALWILPDPPDRLSPRHPLPVLHIYGYNPAMLRLFLEVVPLDLTCLQNEPPHIITVVIAYTLSRQLAFAVGVELFELIADHVVELLEGAVIELFADLALEFLQ